MKRLLPLLLLVSTAAIALTGCGSIKLDGLGTYRPSLFRKDIDEFTFTRNVTSTGTNTLVRLKGYHSGAEALVGAVAAGVAQGMAAQRNSVPVNPQ